MQSSDFLRQTPELGLTHLDLVLAAVLALAARGRIRLLATTAEEMTAAEKHSKHAHGQFQASTDRILSKPKTRLI